MILFVCSSTKRDVILVEFEGQKRQKGFVPGPYSTRRVPIVDTLVMRYREGLQREQDTVLNLSLPDDILSWLDLDDLKEILEKTYREVYNQFLHRVIIKFYHLCMSKPMVIPSDYKPPFEVIYTLYSEGNEHSNNYIGPQIWSTFCATQHYRDLTWIAVAFKGCDSKKLACTFYRFLTSMIDVGTKQLISHAISPAQGVLSYVVDRDDVMISITNIMKDDLESDFS